MNVGEAAMAIQLSDALGITGLSWDDMIDLVRERSMLARVRETWGDDAICARSTSDPGTGHVSWYVSGPRYEPDLSRGPTEREALDVALECKP